MAAYRSNQNAAFVGDQQLLFKWDPKNLNIRTKTIQRLLEPLVTQVTTLANPEQQQQQQQQQPISGRSGKRGGSKKAQVLVAAVERSIENFVQRGEEVIRDNPDGRKELSAALDEVRNTGKKVVFLCVVLISHHLRLNCFRDFRKCNDKRLERFRQPTDE